MIGGHIRTSIKNQDLLKQRRALIASRAVDVFLEKGYERATVRELAEACGMSEGALYRYIGSKEDVLHLILMSFTRGTHLEALLGRLGNVSATEALRECIISHYQNIDEHRRRVRFINREVHRFSEPGIRYVRESQEIVVRFFERLLIRGIESGEFQMDSPLAVAHNIVVLGHAWIHRARFLRQYFTLRQYTEIQISFVLKAIRVKAPQVTERALAQEIG